MRNTWICRSAGWPTSLSRSVESRSDAFAASSAGPRLAASWPRWRTDMLSGEPMSSVPSSSAEIDRGRDGRGSGHQRIQIVVDLEDRTAQMPSQPTHPESGQHRYVLPGVHHFRLAEELDHGIGGGEIGGSDVRPCSCSSRLPGRIDQPTPAR